MNKLIGAMDGLINIPFGQETDDYVNEYVLPLVTPEALATHLYQELTTVAEDAIPNMLPFIRLANAIVPLFLAESLAPALDTHPIVSLLALCVSVQEG